MKKLLLIASIIAIVATFLLIPKASVQGQSCQTLGWVSPSQGWSIDSGHYNSGAQAVEDNLHIQMTVTGSAIISVSDWFIREHSENLSLPEFSQIKITVHEFNLFGGDNVFSTVVTGPENHTVHIRTTGTPSSHYQVNVDATSLDGGLTYDPSNWDLFVDGLCVYGVPVVTATGTATSTALPTHAATFTFTPSPSFTPRPPTLTPTPRPTLTPSDTPVGATYTPGPTDTTGPSDTPGPTDTNAPPDTPIPTTTFTPMSFGPGDFSSPIPPDVCTDSQVQCGAYPLPQFPNIDLQSPVPITIITAPASVTPVGLTPNPSGTPFASSTADDLSSSIGSFSTSIAMIPLEQTPMLYDLDGQLIDVENGANQIGANVGDLFSIYRALQGLFLGKTGTLIALLLLIVGFILIVRIILFALPIILRIGQILIGLIP